MRSVVVSILPAEGTFAAGSRPGYTPGGSDQYLNRRERAAYNSNQLTGRDRQRIVAQARARARRRGLL